MGLYRGSNFWILPGVWEVLACCRSTHGTRFRALPRLMRSLFGGCGFRVHGLGIRGFRVEGLGLWGCVV